nr:hypothetical protein CFP56_06901 [Quercus suber]
MILLSKSITIFDEYIQKFPDAIDPSIPSTALDAPSQSSSAPEIERGDETEKGDEYKKKEAEKERGDEIKKLQKTILQTQNLGRMTIRLPEPTSTKISGGIYTGQSVRVVPTDINGRKKVFPWSTIDSR